MGEINESNEKENDNNPTSSDAPVVEHKEIVERTDVELSDGSGFDGKYSGSCLLEVIRLTGDQKEASAENEQGEDNDENDLKGQKKLERLTPHGQGSMEYLNHPEVTSYSGTWKDGNWHGQGVSKMKSGDTYSGEHRFNDKKFDSNGDSSGIAKEEHNQKVKISQRHGFGTYIWKDERKYTGTFEYDFRHGQGCYTWPDGSLYEGNFIKGVPQGYGKYTNRDEEYVGDWKNGQYNGYGVLKKICKKAGKKLKFDDAASDDAGQDNSQNSCKIYKGYFQNGKRHGNGVEINPDGTIHHDGEWEMDQPFTAKSKPPQTATDKAKAGDDDNELIVVENELVTDANGIQGYYRGILHKKTRLPHGNGTMTIATDKADDQQQQQPKPNNPTTNNIKYYEGFFDMGRQHGKGRICWINGDTYDGDFVYGKRSGYGIYYWNNGTNQYYKGEFYNDLRHGKGIFVYNKESTNVYEGSFFEGRRCGYGKFTFDDGSTYDGQWKDGVYHGYGKLINRDGKTYDGNFENGVAHGQGKEIDSNGNIIYDGQWLKGLTVEQSKKAEAFKQQSPSRKEAAKNTALKKDEMDDQPCEAVVNHIVADAEGFIGQYTGIVLSSNQKPHGVGRIVYNDGRRIHEGFWKNGIKHGHGRCLFVREGDYHEGEYFNNVRNGPGTYKWKDGRVFVGHYQNDLRNGKGIFYYPNGDKYEGMFINGDRSGYGRFEFGKSNKDAEGGTGYYEGQWDKGKYHGMGRLVVNDATYEGFFDAGVFLQGSTTSQGNERETNPQYMRHKEEQQVHQQHEEPEYDYNHSKDYTDDGPDDENEGIPSKNSNLRELVDEDFDSVEDLDQ